MAKHDKSLTKKQGWTLLLQYTVIFGVFVAGIFAVLLISHRSFMQYHDAYRQGAFRLIEYKNQLSSILSGDGFNWWSWYEGTGLDESLENFVDPFSLIGALFPIRYIELGFTVAALLRMYCGGLAFLFLGREVDLKRHQNLVGAILYVFSACFIGLALRQSENLKNIFLFPLLVASVERIYKGKRPTLFIFMVAYYMLYTFYFSYMSGITIIIYIVLRYFAYNERFRLKEFMPVFGRFIGYGIIGIMLPAFSWLFSASTLTRASTESTNAVSYGLLPDMKMFSAFGKTLLGTGASYDYEDIGLCILVLMLIPVAVRHCTRKNTNTIMTVLLFVMMQIPIICSMFNGFSYVSYRWSYTLTLFAVWSAAEQLDLQRIKEKGSILLALSGLAVMSVWTAGLYMAGIISLDETGRLFVALQLAAGAALLIVLIIIKRKERMGRAAIAAFLAIPLISLSLGWSHGIASRLDSFAKNASIYNHLQESVLRAGNKIEDDGFYRIDSADGILRRGRLIFPTNESIWWKTNNIFIYNSRIPETLTDFNIELGNSYGYARRVYMVSNGNRMGLDYLFGVRYFLGSDSKNPESANNDNFAGYGFEKVEEIDGVSVFKSKYDAGLGFMLDKAIKESDFDTLNRLEKEQALLQAAVIPDEEAAECDIPFVTAKDLDIDIRDVPYEVVRTDGAKVDENSIKTEKGSASVTLSVKDVPESQLVVSFDNLRRNAKGDGDGGSYLLNAENGRVKSEVLNQHSRQGIRGLVNHDMNMGHCSGDYEITIRFPYKGNYTFDRLYVSAMSTDNFDRYASECEDNSYEVASYNDKEVTGTVDAESDGILFLSIPEHTNWDVYVDGEKAEEINDLDTTFLGAYVPEGKHEVVLKYSNRFVKYGCFVSAAGLLIFLVLLWKTRKDVQKNPAQDKKA